MVRLDDSVLRLRACGRTEWKNNDENASSSDAIDDIVFRLKCKSYQVRPVRCRVNIGFLDDLA
jgi:hypothetical protein